MPLTTKSLANMSAPLFRLPLEIRRDIYTHVFPSTTLRLTEQMIVRAFEISVTKTSATALLKTCSALHEEATPVFYHNARMHYSISWQNPEEPIESTRICLSLLRHISIDFSCLVISGELARKTRIEEVEQRNIQNDAAEPAETNKEGISRAQSAMENVDKAIAACIDSISANCPLLRTFALHLLSHSCFEYGLQDILQNALDGVDSYNNVGTKHTIEALKKLRVRDTIAIIAVATERDYINVLKAITPIKEWQTLKLRKWPGISITAKQVRAVASLVCGLGGTYDDDTDILMWCYRPLGSNMLGLPEYKLVKDRNYAYDSEESDISDSDYDY